MVGSGQNIQGGTGFRLTYRLTRADVAAYVYAPRELTPASIAMFMAILAATTLVAPLLLRAAGVPADDYEQGWGEPALAVAIGLVAWAVHCGITGLYRIVRVRRCPVLYAQTVLLTDELGVTIESQGQSQHYGWAEFGAIAVAREHVYLCLSPAQAIIVPQRAFDPPARMDEFARHAREAWRQAEAEAAAAGAPDPGLAPPERAGPASGPWRAL
jgi:hypothetical protein